MKFTGERYINSFSSSQVSFFPQISYEHWHRYFYATQYVKERDVLDIACGEGYGASLLAQSAKSVVGVDISQEAVEFAIKHYPRSNLSFLQGSVENIPIEGIKKFDVVTSFETIEHVDAGMQEVFLKEVKRLLRDDGIFVVSTPNKLFNSDIRNNKNEFHFKEFYEKEYLEFLSKYFKHVSLLGQKVFAGCSMWQIGVSNQESAYVDYQIRNDGQKFVTDNQARDAIYMVAICSDSKLDPVKNSLLFDSSLSLLAGNSAAIPQDGTELLRRVLMDIKTLGYLIVRKIFKIK